MNQDDEIMNYYLGFLILISVISILVDAAPNWSTEQQESSRIEITIPAEPLNPAEFRKARSLDLNLGNQVPRNSNVFENEIIYSRSFQRERQRQPEIEVRNGIIDERKRWFKVRDHVVIPYLISSKFDERQREIIAKGMQNFHQTTCIRFVPRVREEDYILIFRGTVCDSDVGRIGGEQTVSLGPGCDYADIVIHELNHAVGFWHEQNRPDRDNYITVHLNHVKPENRFNFDKISSRLVNSFGVEYDTDSIMHYDKFAFSKDPKRFVVIEPKVPNPNMGLARVLSDSDIMRIRKMYKCSPGSWDSSSRKPKPGNLLSVRGFDHGEIPLIDCDDYHENCTTFARLATCQEHPWLQVTCRHSCNTCRNICSDHKPECPSWAADGECFNQYDYMRQYCPKSCQFCG